MSLSEIVHRSLRLVRYGCDSIAFRFKLYSYTDDLVRAADRHLFAGGGFASADLGNANNTEEQSVELHMTDQASMDSAPSINSVFVEQASTEPAQSIKSASIAEMFLESNHDKLAFYRSLWLENKVQLFDANACLQLDTPVQWLKDPKTGTQTPLRFGRSIDYRDDQSVGEIKYLWELGRHQFLVPMAIRVASERDEKVQTVLASHLSGWVEQNPPGMGIHWCSSLELSLRLISWSLVHSVLQCGGMKNGVFDLAGGSPGLKTHIYAQVKFVVENHSRFSSSNNHLIGELAGVWIACNVFDLGARGKRWRESALVELEREIELQTHEDGVNKEQAVYYHLWSLEYFWLVWLVAKRYEQPVSQGFEERIVAMYNFLNAMCSQTELPSQIGDADGGVVARFSPDVSENVYRSLLESITDIFASTSEQSLTRSSVYSKVFWYGKIIADCDVSSIIAIYERSQKNMHGLDAFEYGGYYVIQGVGCRMLYKAGPFGYLTTAAHSHADALSVTLAIEGQWWLVDPGTYTYHTSGEWRNYFRSTAAHNTLCVNQTDQSEIAGDFLWAKKTDAQVRDLQWGTADSRQYVSAVTGFHSGYADQGVQHERTVKCDGQYSFEVHDLISISEASRPYDLQLAFHFHPDIELRQLHTHQWLVTRQDSAASMTIALPEAFHWSVVSGRTNPIAGWYSESYGSKTPSSMLSGRMALNGDERQKPNLYSTMMVVRLADGAALSDGVAK